MCQYILVCQKENINQNKGNLLLFRIRQDNVYNTYIRIEILEQSM